MTESNETPRDEFESPLTDTLTLKRRGAERTYHFTELTEEQMEAVLKGDNDDFGNRLVCASCADHTGAAMTRERLRGLPAGIGQKIRLKALEVNGFDAAEAEKAGEA